MEVPVAVPAIALAPIPPITPIDNPKPKRVVKKRSPSELQDYKLAVARKQNTLRWDTEQLRDTEADQQLASGERLLQLMDLPNELLGAIFCPIKCPRGKAAPVAHRNGCECASRHRALCTMLCRRTYYLFRQHIQKLYLYIPYESDVPLYNTLRTRAERPNDWQDTAHTLTPMPALRKVMYYAKSIDTFTGRETYGAVSTVTRAAVPWYYLAAVTTKEQRRLMELQIGFDHVQGFGGVKFRPDVFLLVLEFGRLVFWKPSAALVVLKKIRKELPQIEAYCRDQRAMDFAQWEWPTIEFRWNDCQPVQEWDVRHPLVARMCQQANVHFQTRTYENLHHPYTTPRPFVQQVQYTYQMWRFLPPNKEHDADDNLPLAGPLQMVGEPVVGPWEIQSFEED